MPTNDQRASWQRMNDTLDAHGDGPEYRAAFAEWAWSQGHAAASKSILGTEGHDNA